MADFSGRTDINMALIGGSSEESSPVSSNTPRARKPLDATKINLLSITTDSPGESSPGGDDPSSDAQNPPQVTPRRVRKEGGGLAASWDGPLQSRSLLKESLMAAESKTGAFGSPLENQPGSKSYPAGGLMRMSFDRLLAPDSPLGTPKIAKGRERHVDSPKDTPVGSFHADHGFSFASGGVGSRHAPLLGSPLGMGQSLSGGVESNPAPLGVTIFKREAIQEGGEPLARNPSLKKLGLSIAIPDSGADADPPAPKAFETDADVSKLAGAVISPGKKLAAKLAVGEKPLDKLLGNDKLSASRKSMDGGALPSSFSTGLTLPILNRISSAKKSAKVAPEPLRISDEVVRSFGGGKDLRGHVGEPISSQRVSGDKRKKDHVDAGGYGEKSFSGVDSLMLLSRTLSPKAGPPKAKNLLTDSQEVSLKLITDPLEPGSSLESVIEVARSKPGNSSPWRPLDQGPGAKTPSTPVKKGGRDVKALPEDLLDSAGPSGSHPDGSDVVLEQKQRQQETANGANSQKASREPRATRRSTRSSSRDSDDGGDRASTAPHGLPTERDWTWSDFKVRREVGVGRYSTVYQAEVRANQFPVALKMYHQKKMDSYVENQVRREIRLHCRVHHKHISDIYGHFEDKEGNICLVLEWAPLGDVFEDRRKSKGPLSEERAVREVVQPLMFALRYMHKQGIIHRDIKPENILVFPNKLIKLADFGFAIDINEQRPCTRLGTTDYMAPEIINVDDEHRDREKGNYDAAVDAWAVGILAYELLTGRPPFQSDSRKETYALIRKGDVVIPSYISTEAASFILTALTRNQHRRPGVTQLLHHPWILTHGVRSTHRRSYSHSPVRSRHGSVAKSDSPVVNTDPIVSSPTAEDGARARRAPKNRSLGGDMLAASHSTSDLSNLAKKSALRAAVGESLDTGLAGFKGLYGDTLGGGSIPSSPKGGDADGGARTPHYMSSLKGVMKSAFARSKSQKDIPPSPGAGKSKPGLISRMTSKGSSNSST